VPAVGGGIVLYASHAIPGWRYVWQIPRSSSFI
jgi:hypothetical protein